MIAVANNVTLYLARKLYIPSGCVLERFVVAVSAGCVIEWYPFERETHSMLFVDELFVSRNGDGVLLVEDIRF